MSYGAEANDLLRIALRIIENQKAEINQVYSIADNKSLQVDVLTKVVEVQRKQTFWQKLWAWIRGAAVGVATYVVVQSLTE